MSGNKLSIIYDRISIAEDGCWNWTKSCCKEGYGQLTIDGVHWRTHRYVAYVVYGLNPNSELLVRHECHNRKCCNPHHLTIGTHKDNYHDSLYEHSRGTEKRSLRWIVEGVEYPNVRMAIKATGLTAHALVKNTDKCTRIFDTDAYREGCKKSRVTPKL